jgi:adenylosuccinate synthase
MPIHCIVGGQYGSEAKGHVAAQVTQELRRDLRDRRDLHLVRVGGSNAGHSAVDAAGVTWALRQIPAAAVIDRDAWLYIAQGSEIDCDVLFHEVETLDAAGFDVSSRLIIDRYATVVEPHHIAQEAGSDINARTGSTQKGIGAARAARLMRQAQIAERYDRLRDAHGTMFHSFNDTASMFAERHNEGAHIVVEGTQGYGLGLHTDNYPQTTSGNCRTVDLLAQIGYVPLNHARNRDVYTWLVFRTYPIRVAGNSGTMLNELSWDELGAASGGYIQPERTTVTKKTRRVAEWDRDLARAAITANGGRGQHLRICLMFADYLDPNIAGIDNHDTLCETISDQASDWITARELELGVTVTMLGTSPSTVVWNYVAQNIINKGR